MKFWVMTIIFMNITLQDNLIKTFNNKKIWQIFKHAQLYSIFMQLSF
jgi:hypothetical protein